MDINGEQVYSVCVILLSPPRPPVHSLVLVQYLSAVLGLGDRKLYLRRYKYLRWYRWLYSEVVLRLDGVSLELEGCLLIGDRKNRFPTATFTSVTIFMWHLK